MRRCCRSRISTTEYPPRISISVLGRAPVASAGQLDTVVVSAGVDLVDWAFVPAKTPVVIATARMILRPPRVQDAPEYFDRLTSDATVTRYVGWPRHQVVADTLAFIRYSDDVWAQDGMGPLLMFDADSRRLIGTTGLSAQPGGVAMTGYVLATDAWGQGLATEALSAMVRLGAEQGLHSLVAGVHEAHAASIRVLRKCGFVLRARDSTYVFPNLPADAEDSQGARLDFVRILA